VKDPRGLEQGEQYPPLEIVKPYEKRTTIEHRIVTLIIFGLLMRGSQGLD